MTYRIVWKEGDVIHEYWPSGGSMTDRIKQMAEEAGLAYPCKYDSGQMLSTNDRGFVIDEELAKFAALVAEDCARICDARWRDMKDTERAHYAQTNQPFMPSAFGFSHEDYAGKSFATEIRNRYGIKGE